MSFFHNLIKIAIVLMFLGGGFSANANALFTGDSDLEGFLWTATIGWISLSCENTNSCSSFPYGVTVSDTNDLVGYAWSPNIGWVQFGNLSSFPSASGNTATNAVITNDGFGGFELQGWARACAGTVSGDCATMQSRTDGWDGWISLKGNSYRVAFSATGTIVPSSPNHFAWGSEVLGWVDWKAVSIKPQAEIITFSADPLEIPLGNQTTLEWQVQGVTACEALNNRGSVDWSGPVSFAYGIHTRAVTPVVGTTQYTLRCVDSDGVPIEKSQTVIAKPNIIVSGPVLSGTLPVPAPNGEYNGVQFLAGVSGIPPTESADYVFTFGPYTLTGTVNSPGNITDFSPSLSLSGVVFGNYIARLEVDLPEPGDIDEDVSLTSVDEDVQGNMGQSSTIYIPPAPINMSITIDDEYVRRNQQTTVRWSVTAPYVAECSVFGPGVDVTFVTSGDYLIPDEGSSATSQLKNKTEYYLVCTEPSTNTTFQQMKEVEVVPGAEEI